MQKPYAVSSELVRLSSAVVRAINDRDFDFQSEEAQELVAHLSLNFQAQLDTRPQQESPLSWAEQVHPWRERAAEYPDVHFDIVQISADVDEVNGVGSVFLDMEVSGIEVVRLHAMNQLQWKRDIDGRWLCCSVV